MLHSGFRVQSPLKPINVTFISKLKQTIPMVKRVRISRWMVVLWFNYGCKLFIFIAHKEYENKQIYIA